jgi:3-hydroxymyristoyl/3-hydroxydecanoyl-(acyl carrier protein) dehydratase
VSSGVVDLDIEAVLPHRGAMLLVDRIVERTPTRLVGEHDVHADAFWTAGHFPGRPVFPGVLQVEFAAQLAWILFGVSGPGTDSAGALATIRRCSFRRIVTPVATLVATVVRTNVTAEPSTDQRRAATFNFRIESARAVVSDGSLTLALIGPGPSAEGPNQPKENRQ